jgi:hypothetical protein
MDEQPQDQPALNELHNLALTLDPELTISRELLANLAELPVMDHAVPALASALILLEQLVRFGPEDAGVAG